MFFKQFLDERCGCVSYLIASRQSHEAAVIDPALDTRQYDEILPERGFRLRSAIATHVHADSTGIGRREDLFSTAQRIVKLHSRRECRAGSWEGRVLA